MAIRQYTENEKKLIEGISIPTYYNKNITVLDSKFRPMKGDKPSSLCPFHDDTDPSLHYWKEKNVFRCFGCGEVGDVIKMHQLIQKLYHKKALSREQAIKELGTLFDIELEFDEQGELVAPSPLEMARNKVSNAGQYDLKLRDMNSMTVANFRLFNNQIKNNKTLQDYRKVSNYERLDIMLAAYLMKTK